MDEDIKALTDSVLDCLRSKGLAHITRTMAEELVRTRCKNQCQPPPVEELEAELIQKYAASSSMPHSVAGSAYSSAKSSMGSLRSRSSSVASSVMSSAYAGKTMWVEGGDLGFCAAGACAACKIKDDIVIELKENLIVLQEQYKWDQGAATGLEEELVKAKEELAYYKEQHDRGIATNMQLREKYDSLHANWAKSGDQHEMVQASLREELAKCQAESAKEKAAFQAAHADLLDFVGSSCTDDSQKELAECQEKCRQLEEQHKNLLLGFYQVTEQFTTTQTELSTHQEELAKCQAALTREKAAVQAVKAELDDFAKHSNGFADRSKKELAECKAELAKSQADLFESVQSYEGLEKNYKKLSKTCKRLSAALEEGEESLKTVMMGIGKYCNLEGIPKWEEVIKKLNEYNDQMERAHAIIKTKDQELQTQLKQQGGDNATAEEITRLAKMVADLEAQGLKNAEKHAIDIEAKDKELQELQAQLQAQLKQQEQQYLDEKAEWIAERDALGLEDAEKHAIDIKAKNQEIRELKQELDKSKLCIEDVKQNMVDRIAELEAQVQDNVERFGFGFDTKDEKIKTLQDVLQEREVHITKLEKLIRSYEGGLEAVQNKLKQKDDENIQLVDKVETLTARLSSKTDKNIVDIAAALTPPAADAASSSNTQGGSSGWSALIDGVAGALTGMRPPTGPPTKQGGAKKKNEQVTVWVAQTKQKVKNPVIHGKDICKAGGMAISGVPWAWNFANQKGARRCKKGNCCRDIDPFDGEVDDE